MKKIAGVIILLLVSLLTINGCAPAHPEVARIDPDEDVDLTGEWSADDSRRVAETMVSDALNRPWLDRFHEEEGKRPTVIVGLFRNRGAQHIDPEMFTNDIQRELINSGRVDFVAGDEQREALREERQDQAEFADPATAAALGMEAGADYMLQGTFISDTQRVEGTRVISYRVDMELMHLQTNRIAWQGTERIRKRVDQAGWTW